ncbi:hypothetical protein Areg01_52240 [Actinoplanes regularis]|nr:hypothetical protein Areg01_52240 [Actinoplanes regularis]
MINPPNKCSNDGVEHEQDRRERTHRWVQDEADRHHGGNWLEAAVAILDAARVSELRPDDPWAYLEARQHGRGAK